MEGNEDDVKVWSQQILTKTMMETGKRVVTETMMKTARAETETTSVATTMTEKGAKTSTRYCDNNDVTTIVMTSGYYDVFPSFRYHIYIYKHWTRGVCWAFGAIAAIESLNFMHTRNMISLSEQYLIDCDSEFNNGYTVGKVKNAFDFILKHGGGVPSEEDYPYIAKRRRLLDNQKLMG